jgi:dephospho-CoA kinase
MTRVALTGGIATGKSYVARRLREAGVPVVDADVLARDAVARGSPGLEAVTKRFGPSVVTASGDLDRARLGEMVFADTGARRDLEAIIHPVVRSRMAQFFEELPAGTRVAVADIPLLFETGREHLYDKVIVVACAPATQIERIIARDNLSRDAAQRRLAAQLPIEAKVSRADYVIRTDETYEETDAQVASVLDSLQGLAP